MAAGPFSARGITAQAVESVDASWSEGFEPWISLGACKQSDKEQFFPEKGDSASPAQLVCGSCPVRQHCLDYAMDNDIRFGVWGGLSARQRQKLVKDESYVIHGEQARRHLPLWPVAMHVPAQRSDPPVQEAPRRSGRNVKQEIKILRWFAAQGGEVRTPGAKVAEFLATTPGAARQAIKELRYKGLLAYRGKTINTVYFLTDQGRQRLAQAG